MIQFPLSVRAACCLAVNKSSIHWRPFLFCSLLPISRLQRMPLIARQFPFQFFFIQFFFSNRYVNYLAENYLILFFCGQCCGLTPALFCASASFLSVFGDVCVIGSKRTAGSGTPSPLVCPPTHPQRHLTIFHLGFPPENTHALTHSRTRATFRFLFYFHFYFISGLFFCCFPLPTPSVVGVPVSGQLWKKRTLALLFLDIEKNLPLDDGQHMPLR